jgi:hypothetical protein
MSDNALNPPAGDDTARQLESSSFLHRLPMRAIESAGFLALVTAIFYFMGYSYYAGFFARISLPPPYPELRTSDYFLRAFSSLTGILVVLVSIPYRSAVPATIWQAFWINSAFIIVPLILAHNARSNGFLDQSLALILGVVAAVAIIASIWKLSVMKLLTSGWELAGAIAYGFGILLIFSVYFELEGAADATRFIEGRLHPSSSIVLQTSDPESPVNGERLLVALMRGGSFYLVQQESPAPEAPVAYFVPESEVLSATIQRAEAVMAVPEQ